MAKYTNFYETVKEANMRLQYSVVLYEGNPYYVICVCSHSDGIFRIYLDPTGQKDGAIMNTIGCPIAEYPDGSPGLPAGKTKSQLMDEWMETAGVKDRVIRRFANSPGFKRFQPFPLGMVNVEGQVFYSERNPQRHTQQGLIQNMLTCAPISLDGSQSGIRLTKAIDVQSAELRDTIINKYPHINECISNLINPNVRNNAVAFHRKLALLRGPVNTLFLAYKTDIVGFLPNGNATVLKLCTHNIHLREILEEQGLFGSIV